MIGRNVTSSVFMNNAAKSESAQRRMSREERENQRRASLGGYKMIPLEVDFFVIRSRTSYPQPAPAPAPGS